MNVGTHESGLGGEAVGFKKGGVTVKVMFTVSAILFLLSFCLTASDGDLNRATLRGLPAIHVVVEDLSSDAIKDGLTVEQIQTDVELRLRKAGITVTSSRIDPALYINVHQVKGADETDNLYAYNCTVSLDQIVTVKSNGVSAVVATWSTEGVGMVKRINMSRRIRDNLGDLVDRFLNAYLSVNPKK